MAASTTLRTSRSAYKPVNTTRLGRSDFSVSKPLSKSTNRHARAGLALSSHLLPRSAPSVPQSGSRPVLKGRLVPQFEEAEATSPSTIRNRSASTEQFQNLLSRDAHVFFTYERNVYSRREGELFNFTFYDCFPKHASLVGIAPSSDAYELLYEYVHKQLLQGVAQLTRVSFEGDNDKAVTKKMSGHLLYYTGKGMSLVPSVSSSITFSSLSAYQKYPKFSSGNILRGPMGTFTCTLGRSALEPDHPTPNPATYEPIAGRLSILMLEDQHQAFLIIKRSGTRSDQWLIQRRMCDIPVQLCKYIGSVTIQCSRLNLSQDRCGAFIYVQGGSTPIWRPSRAARPKGARRRAAEIAKRRQVRETGARA